MVKSKPPPQSGSSLEAVELHKKGPYSFFEKDSYFTVLLEVFTNHILAENTYFTNHFGRTEHKIMVLKPADKYIISRQCHNFENILAYDFLHHPTDEEIDHSSIYLLFDLLWR